MKHVKFEWLSDSWECDCCGSSFAEGVTVYLNGDVIHEVVPLAHCFGGTHEYTFETYENTLKALSIDPTPYYDEHKYLDGKSIKAALEDHGYTHEGLYYD